MPKEPRVYFAVRVGRKPGIYTTWEDCREQVHGYPRAVYKKIKNRDEAEGWIKGVGSSSPTTTPTPTPTPIAGLGSNSSPVARRSNGPLSARAGPSKPTSSSSSAGFGNVVYTDGACPRNGQVGSVAGIGVWWGPGDPRNLSERCPGSPQTNNRAELIAIIRALETAPIEPIPLVIKSDSKYAMQCIKDWLPKWRKKGFCTSGGTHVRNSELVMYADTLISKRKQASQHVVFEHVLGHAGEPGNEGADALAVHGCKLREAADARNWAEIRYKLEKELKKKTTAVFTEPKSVDASIFADMVLDEEQLLAELEEG